MARGLHSLVSLTQNTLQFCIGFVGCLRAVVIVSEGCLQLAHRGAVLMRRLDTADDGSDRSTSCGGYDGKGTTQTVQGALQVLDLVFRVVSLLAGVLDFLSRFVGVVAQSVELVGGLVDCFLVALQFLLSGGDLTLEGAHLLD